MSEATDTEKEDGSGRKGSRTILLDYDVPPVVAAAQASPSITSAPSSTMPSGPLPLSSPTSLRTSYGPSSRSLTTSACSLTSSSSLPATGPSPPGPAPPRQTDTDKIVPKTFIHAFSGPSGRQDGFAAYLATLGHHCVEYDILNDKVEQNLADERILQNLIGSLGTCAGLLIGPPCRTFSRARRHGGGPPPLRGTHGKERYGLKNLKKTDHDKVRLDTLLAINTANILLECISKKVPFIMEFPLPSDGVCSVCDLDEYKHIINNASVIWAEIDQCRWGAYSVKPTVLLMHLVDPPEFATKSQTAVRSLSQHFVVTGRCNHAPRDWRYPSGRILHARHPPLKGFERAVPAEEPDLDTEAAKKYITSAAAAYPAAMNQWTAEALTAGLAEEPSKPISNDTKTDQNQDEREAALHQQFGRRAGIHYSKPLRGQTDANEKLIEENAAVGGLRRAGAAVDKLNHLAIQGAKARIKLERFMHDNFLEVNWMMSLIGLPVVCVCSGSHPDSHPVVCTRPAGSPTSSFSSSSTSSCPACRLARLTDAFRIEFAKVLDCSADDLEPVAAENQVSTALRPGLFAAWRRYAHDPETEVEQWLRLGAPCGIAHQPKDAGIFPVVGDTPELSADHLEPIDTEMQDDSDIQTALEELKTYVDKGFIKQFNTEQEITDFLGHRPTLSKLVVLKKLLADGREKKRVILDCKSSGVSAASVRAERVFLPRVVDAVFDTLDLYKDNDPKNVELTVMDVSEAFLEYSTSPRRAPVLHLLRRWLLLRVLARGPRVEMRPPSVGPDYVDGHSLLTGGGGNEVPTDQHLRRRPHHRSGR